MRRSVRGKWVLDHAGHPTPPQSFTRGLQTSGLTYLEGRLWSVGDQRSRYPGHLLPVDRLTARLSSPPLRPNFDASLDNGHAEADTYRRIPNSDFEALCRHPSEARSLFAVTEDKVPWVVEIRLLSPTRATFKQFSRIEFPAGLGPWRGDTNFRCEGAAVSDDAATLFVAFERADDDLPRILSVPLEAVRSGKTARLRDLAFPFGTVPPRVDKPAARLNINGLDFFRHEKRAYLAAVARDQERLLFLDVDGRRIQRIVDLDLTGPDGGSVKWVSPEGLAIDRATDRLWLINDPDSVRGNYRALADERARGPFADYTPLLFEMGFTELFAGE